MQRDHAGLPPGEDLRELAAWYREFAERAGSTVIWEARLRMAEEAMSRKRVRLAARQGRLPAWISSPTADIASRRRSSSTRSGFICGSR